MTTFVDLFCGAGGSSNGLVLSGWQLLLGANHDERAIETHAANHTDADHLCAAGPIRNQEMVKDGAHYCLAFPGGPGTANCRRLALNARIPVIDIKENHHG